MERNKDRIQPKLFSLELKDDILIIRYLTNQEITLEHAKFMIQCRKEICQGKDAKMMVVYPHLQRANKEVREYTASDEAIEGIVCAALVSTSFHTRILLQLYLSFNLGNKAGYPVKLFSSEEKALTWLRNYNLN